jgi:hypothetical protein
MSNTGKGLIGALALTLGGLGAAQLAFGQDVAESLQSFTSVSNSGLNHHVNRVAKTDRAPHVITPAAPMQTISVQLHGGTETSVAVRIPLTPRDQASTPAPLRITSPSVACEPVVSVLTEVAKQLQPGRCVS